MPYKYFDQITQEECDITAETCIYLTKVSANYAIKGIARDNIRVLPRDPQTRQVNDLLIISNPTTHEALFEDRPEHPGVKFLKQKLFTEADLQKILGPNFFKTTPEGGAERFAFSGRRPVETAFPSVPTLPVAAPPLLSGSSSTAGLRFFAAPSIPLHQSGGPVRTFLFSIAVFSANRVYEALRDGVLHGTFFARLDFQDFNREYTHFINLSVYNCDAYDRYIHLTSPHFDPVSRLREEDIRAVILVHDFSLRQNDLLDALASLHRGFTAQETAAGRRPAIRSVCALRNRHTTETEFYRLRTGLEHELATLDYPVTLGTANGPDVRSDDIRRVLRGISAMLIEQDLSAAARVSPVPRS